MVCVGPGQKPERWFSHEAAHFFEFQFPNVINLNVGGKKFATRLSTLRKYPDSMLAVMFSGRHEVETDQDNNYFIDRSVFEPRLEKTCLRGFRPGLTQTELYSHRRWLEA